MKNEIKEEIKKFLETNENELPTVKNLWVTAKAFLRGKFIAIQAYLKRIETFSNKQPTPTPTRTRGTTTKATQSKYKEGNNQDQSRVKRDRDSKHKSKDRGIQELVL